ncbi:MAG: FAD-binding oxidoreductase, partial [Flavobacterium sp.]
MRTEKVCDLLKSIVGEQYLYADPEKMYNYAKDFTVAGLRMPCAVVIPNTVEEVSAIAKICNDNRVSLTVRGGGTGVSGGSLTYDNGIILSLERLNRILSINKIDRIVIAEAGV